MALDFTLLTEEQIWGDEDGNGQLDVMDKYDTVVAPTDLTLLLRGYDLGELDPSAKDSCTSWTATCFEDGDVQCVDRNGDGTVLAGCKIREFSVRPALSPSETEKLTLTRKKKDKSGVDIVEYGEYPQTLADKQTSAQLEDLFQSQSLSLTGKNYTFDSVAFYDYDTEFKPISFAEYELDGKKYIRVPSPLLCNHSRWPGGEQIQTGEPNWFQVQPIEWLVDRSGTWVSKKCLLTGIQFDTGKEHDSDFSKTFMKKYLDTYFAKEMEPSELESDKNRKKVLTGLSAQLEGATNEDAVEAIKKRLMTAEKGKKTQTSPDRLDEAARMQRLMNARNILINAAQQAYDAGDSALLDGIVDLSQHYEVLYNARKRRVATLRARRRVQRKQGDR